MEAGRMRHRITIQYKVVVKDTYGAETITWTTYHSCWAEIEPLTGREFLESRQTQAEEMLRMTTRYKSGITPAMRVSWSSRYFDIQSVIEVEELGREIQLMCTEQL